MSNIHVSTCAHSYTRRLHLHLYLFLLSFRYGLAFDTTPCFPRANSLQLRVVLSWPSLVLMPVRPGAFIDDVNPSKTIGNKKNHQLFHVLQVIVVDLLNDGWYRPASRRGRDE